MIDLDQFSLRELQVESAIALSTMESTNNNISAFNKQAHHNSQQWYKSVIYWYISEYGNLPSKAGPGKHVKLIYNNV